MRSKHKKSRNAQDKRQLSCIFALHSRSDMNWKFLLFFVISISSTQLGNAQTPQSESTAFSAIAQDEQPMVWQASSKLDSLATAEFYFLQADTLEKNNAIWRVGDAMLHTFGAPLKWQKKDWARFGGLVVGTVALTTLDEPMQDLMHNSQGDFGDALEPIGFHNGKPYAGMITTGGFYLYGLAFDNEWAKETGIALGASYASAGLLQAGMKQLFGRARPGTNVGPYHFRPFSNDPSYSSFPSGHVQMAMVTSVVLAERVDQIWLKGLFYTGAGLTIWSRMYEDAHWLSDVAFGTVVSYVISKRVMKRLDQNKYKNFQQDPVTGERKSKISWQFSPTYNSVGFIGTF